MHDPSIEVSEVQTALIKAMQASRDLDKRRGTHFSQNTFVLERLVRFGIDPKSLSIVGGFLSESEWLSQMTKEENGDE